MEHAAGLQSSKKATQAMVKWGQRKDAWPLCVQGPLLFQEVLPSFLLRARTLIVANPVPLTVPTHACVQLLGPVCLHTQMQAQWP